MNEANAPQGPRLTVKGQWLRWAPFLILACSAAVLVLSWDVLPERWITHWNIEGQPDGWSTRSFFGVFGILLLGSVVCISMELTISSMVAMSKGTQSALPEATRTYLNRMTGELVRTFNVSMALVLSFLAVALPFLQPQSPRLILWLVLPTILGALGIGMYRWNRDYHRGITSGEIQPIEGYNGLFYNNPKDSRLMVPKLTGMGSTFNFAHPWAWPLLGLILLFPVAAIVFLLTQV